MLAFCTYLGKSGCLLRLHDSLLGWSDAGDCGAQLLLAGVHALLWPRGYRAKTSRLQHSSFKNAFSAAMACNFCFEKNASAQSHTLSLSLSLFLSRGVNAILYFRTQLNSTTLGIACRKENQKTNQKLQTTTREKCVSKTSSPLAGYQRAFGFRFSSFGRVDVDAVTTLRLLSFKRNRGKEPGTARPSALIFLQVRALSSRCLSSEFGSLLSSLSSLCLLSVSLFCKKKQKNSVKI